MVSGEIVVHTKSDDTSWVVQEYDAYRKKWMYCYGTANKEDAINEICDIKLAQYNGEDEV